MPWPERKGSTVMAMLLRSVTAQVCSGHRRALLDRYAESCADLTCANSRLCPTPTRPKGFPRCRADPILRFSSPCSARCRVQIGRSEMDVDWCDGVRDGIKSGNRYKRSWKLLRKRFISVRRKRRKPRRPLPNHLYTAVLSWLNLQSTWIDNLITSMLLNLGLCLLCLCDLICGLDHPLKS